MASTRWMPSSQRSARVVSAPVSSVFTTPPSLGAASAQPRKTDGPFRAPKAPSSPSQPVPSPDAQPAQRTPGSGVRPGASAAVLEAHPASDDPTSKSGDMQAALAASSVELDDIAVNASEPIADAASRSSAALTPPATDANSALDEAVFTTAVSGEAADSDIDTEDAFAIDSDLPELPEGYSYLGRRMVSAFRTANGPCPSATRFEHHMLPCCIQCPSNSMFALAYLSVRV